MCVALASLLSKRRVRSDVAMTGEISLRGRVMRVGGIKEKVLAASRFGVKQVILPEGNQPDWLDVPAEVRAKLKVHFVKQISEVLQARAGGEMKLIFKRWGERPRKPSFAKCRHGSQS